MMEGKTTMDICFAASGYKLALVCVALIPTPKLRHILPALVLLRKPLSGLAKRRKQPERYVQYRPKLV
jgi:hypothetical protein